jgi:D-aminoacyl-tRNA deacylase
MIIVIQRVTEANVRVAEETIAEIKQGIVALIGIENHDNEETAKLCIQKLLAMRIFEDKQNKMNLNCKDVKGSLLLVPQFTLAAETGNGNRPSFSKAAPPRISEPLFNTIKKSAQEEYPLVAFGKFAADMKINLTNDGPVTFILNI